VLPSPIIKRAHQEQFTRLTAIVHRVQYSALVDSDIDELAAALFDEAVFEFIGGLPSRAEFDRWFHTALAGPPSNRSGEIWLNYCVRSVDSGSLIGRLEASIHDNLAEVGFLYKPGVWGHGYASEGLLWLQQQLLQYSNVASIWGVTHPGNRRSAALLQKFGFVEAPYHGSPVLYSYDEGDLVFRRGVTSRPLWPDTLWQTYTASFSGPGSSDLQVPF